MINFVKNNVGNPSFKKFILSKSTNKSNTANYIVSQLKEPFPEDNQNRSIVKRAEDNGFDIYINKKKGYTNVYLQKATTNNREKIGSYNSPEKFDVNEFINKYKTAEFYETCRIKNKQEDKYWKAAIWAIIITLAGILIYKNNLVEQLL